MVLLASSAGHGGSWSWEWRAAGQSWWIPWRRIHHTERTRHCCSSPRRLPPTAGPACSASGARNECSCSTCLRGSFSFGVHWQLSSSFSALGRSQSWTWCSQLPYRFRGLWSPWWVWWCWARRSSGSCVRVSVVSLTSLLLWRLWVAQPGLVPCHPGMSFSCLQFAFQLPFLENLS